MHKIYRSFHFQFVFIDRFKLWWMRNFWNVNVLISNPSFIIRFHIFKKKRDFTLNNDIKSWERESKQYLGTWEKHRSKLLQKRLSVMNFFLYFRTSCYSWPDAKYYSSLFNFLLLFLWLLLFSAVIWMNLGKWL